MPRATPQEGRGAPEAPEQPLDDDEPIPGADLQEASARVGSATATSGATDTDATSPESGNDTQDAGIRSPQASSAKRFAALISVFLLIGVAVAAAGFGVYWAGKSIGAFNRTSTATQTTVLAAPTAPTTPASTSAATPSTTATAPASSPTATSSTTAAAPGAGPTVVTSTEAPFLQVLGPLLTALVTISLFFLPALRRFLKTPRLKLDHYATHQDDFVRSSKQYGRWRIRVSNRGFSGVTKDTAVGVEVVVARLTINNKPVTVSGRRLRWTVAADSGSQDAAALRVPPGAERFIDVLGPRKADPENPHCDEAHLSVVVVPKPMAADYQRYDVPWGTTERPTSTCEMVLVAVADNAPSTRWFVSIRPGHAGKPGHPPREDEENLVMDVWQMDRPSWKRRFGPLRKASRPQSKERTPAGAPVEQQEAQPQ